VTSRNIDAKLESIVRSSGAYRQKAIEFFHQAPLPVIHEGPRKRQGSRPKAWENPSRRSLCSHPRRLMGHSNGKSVFQAMVLQSMTTSFGLLGPIEEPAS